MPDTGKQVQDSIMEPTDRLLELVGLAHQGPGPLTVTTGVQGSVDQGLAVIGRAPIGGTGTFSLEDVRTPYGRTQVLTALRRTNPPRGDLSTPFWETARGVALANGLIEEGDEAWAEKVGWSSLYRVAPVDGPITTELRTLQQALCAQLLWREILIWRPRRVLFMTGLAWAAPFVFAHHSSELQAYPSGTFVRATGAVRLQGAKTPIMLVVDPPAPGQESGDAAREITEVFASLGA